MNPVDWVVYRWKKRPMQQEHRKITLSCSVCKRSCKVSRVEAWPALWSKEDALAKGMLYAWVRAPRGWWALNGVLATVRCPKCLKVQGAS